MIETVRNRLWDNPELRRAGLAMGAVTLAFTVLALLLWQMAVSSFHRQGIERDIAVIGMLASRHPELQQEVAQAFTGQVSPEEFAEGTRAAAKLGYDAELPVRFNREVDRLRLQVAAGLAAAGLLMGGCLLLPVTLAFRSVYRKALLYAEMAERMVDGDFREVPDRPAEGAFSKLAHQFGQMARRLELTLERLQAEKEGMKKLLSDISHQLKTPLTALQMFVELAQEEELPPAKRREFLAKGEDQIGRMSWLIRQLLTVARLEAGAARLEKRELPLVPTVAEAMEGLRPKAQKQGVELALRSDGMKPYLLNHDPAWLGEAVGNIVKNGIEHTPGGGRVEIELEETSVLLRIHIRDNGRGIPENEVPRIFERFYKGSGSDPGGGAGIGLALSKAIIEQHDGFIGVRSSLGQGTVFTVTLPKKLTKP